MDQPGGCASQFQSIFDQYMNLILVNTSDYAEKRIRLKLPIISPDIVKRILSEVRKIFEKEGIVIYTKSPLVVVGDLHGQILDLFRILSTYGFPPESRYVFLGDMVDRGSFSTETALLIFMMKILWPSDVLIVRGNHEFKNVCERGGFFKEINEIYYDCCLGEQFCDVFAQMPLAAVIDNHAVCLHGGIGPNVPELSTIKYISRPISNFDDEMVTDILWSDPTENITMFMPSNRGTGFLFGSMALDAFLKDSRLKLLIRGHQCIEDGCAFSMNGSLVTVFSASNYCGVTGNMAGVLLVNGGKYEPMKFPPLQELKRCDVVFLGAGDEPLGVSVRRGRLSSFGPGSALKSKLPPIPSRTPSMAKKTLPVLQDVRLTLDDCTKRRSSLGLPKRTVSKLLS